MCGDRDCFSDCEVQEIADNLDIDPEDVEFAKNDISDWVWKDGHKYPGGDGTVWVSEQAPMRVWEMQAALARLNPTDHVLSLIHTSRSTRTSSCIP